MPIQKQSYQIQGMRQDNLVATGASTKFAHEIMNMRLNTIGDYTTASWTTEKGTKRLTIIPMPKGSGTYYWLDRFEYEDKDFQPLGQAVINDYWVLFGKLESNVDAILLLKYKDENTLGGRVLYIGDLGFDLQHPIETLAFYENEIIQKVYWTDNKNQPRVINICGADDSVDGFDSTKTKQFDFVQEVSLSETVDIIKDSSGTGLFPPCTVKYAITYYHKYGQETNIVYDSPLYYPTLGNRACSPDELSGDSFKIKVTGIDNTHGFDYIRLYSIIRTSDNATPIVRIVDDIPIDEHTTEVNFTDTNTTGTIVDPSILNYVGGKNILVETMSQKDNVLFLGNITLTNKSVTSIVDKYDASHLGSPKFVYSDGGNPLKIIPSIITQTSRASSRIALQSNNYYSYVNQLNSNNIVVESISGDFNFPFKGNSFDIKTFKKGEYYRVGIQFQDSNGIWSEIYRLSSNLECTKEPQLIKKTAIQDLDLYKSPVIKYSLPLDVAQDLIDNGYKKARLVCCYTTNSDRSFIAQGVVNQTVYNYEDAGKTDPNSPGSPYMMSSWFFRPFGVVGDIGPSSPTQSYRIGNEEIQSIYDDATREINWTLDSIINFPNSSTYETRPNYWTLNSPEIEFDESIRTLDTRSFSIKTVGDFKISSRASSIYVDATSPAPNSVGEIGTGLQGTTSVELPINSFIGVMSHNFNYSKWNDCDVFYSLGGHSKVSYPLIPFQRTTSLNDYVKDIKWSYDGEEVTIKQHAKLNSKIWANEIYSKSTIFENTENNEVIKNYSFTNIKDIQFFDSLENTPILVNDKVYFGNNNTIANIIEEDEATPHIDFTYPIPCVRDNSYSGTFSGAYKLERFSGSSRTNEYVGKSSDGYVSYKVYSSDPVKVTYKSTPHVVFYGTMSDNGNSSTPVKPFYIAEIYRADITNDQRFGGENNRNNIYTPCGPAVTLSDTGNTVMYGYEGDHYLMRYDCLKTYPYTTEDPNQIVEIISFMCESRINLDGRYDKNRGLIDNTIVLPTNFNLINKSYTQSNNFFSYTELKDDKVAVEVDEFPNQITWTKEKVSGEDVDAWTNITLASTADADGTVGKISKIINLNDRLFLFQDHALAQINYNENTAISTEANIPLELAKTGKFTGFNYITKEIGCQNKWSISSTKNGLLWIDDSRQELLRYGEGIQSLSTTLGFDAFMIKQLPTMFKAWNPSDFDNFVTYYDKLSNDVYYINKNTCLAWNEQTGTFTSFYNYENTPYMASLGSHSVMWHNSIWAARESDNYSTFFNTSKDYWMTLVCDGMVDKGNAFPADKVFNNVEYRADIYNLDGTNTNYSVSVFNKKQAWNGYQDSNECPLDGIRKFNTWRIQLPRHYGTRDRIRNPFCYIKLKQDQSVNLQTDRVILHDLAVYFDMK